MFISFLVLLLLCPQQTLAVAWKSDATTIQFENWYPQFGYVFRRILAENCTEKYADYLTAVKNTTKIDVSLPSISDLHTFCLGWCYCAKFVSSQNDNARCLLTS